MIKREITKEFIQSAAEYPVVTVLGPRQSGKTTLSRMTFPDKPYRSLENPDTRHMAQSDPRGFFSELPEGAILDEIQRVPELLSYIQGIVDDSNKPGRFILTGSHQPEVHQAISQSLAGRTSVLTLLPFSLSELNSFHRMWEPFDLIVSGCFPRLHQENLEPTRFFNGYIQTYLERDIRALINLKNIRSFQQFLMLLAGRIGRLVNYSSLSNDIGVSANTIRDWISVLQASQVVLELSPYFENIRKRVVKSSKLYFCDTGLAAHLIGITEGRQLLRDPLRGPLYENFVILEIIKKRLNNGQRKDLYFYRDNHGNEVDVLIPMGRELIPVEIKSSETFFDDFHKGIRNFKKIVGKRCRPGAVIYNGDQKLTYKDSEVFNIFRHDGLYDILG